MRTLSAVVIMVTPPVPKSGVRCLLCSNPVSLSPFHPPISLFLLCHVFLSAHCAYFTGFRSRGASSWLSAFSSAFAPGYFSVACFSVLFLSWSFRSPRVRRLFLHIRRPCLSAVFIPRRAGYFPYSSAFTSGVHIFPPQQIRKEAQRREGIFSCQHRLSAFFCHPAPRCPSLHASGSCSSWIIQIRRHIFVMHFKPPLGFFGKPALSTRSSPTTHLPNDF